MANESEHLTWLERQALQANLRLVMIGEWVLLMWGALAWAFLYYVGERNGWSWGAIAGVSVGVIVTLFALRGAERKLHMDD